MPIEICPQCAAPIEYGPEHLGRKARCPSCQHVYALPTVMPPPLPPPPPMPVPHFPDAFDAPEREHQPSGKIGRILHRRVHPAIVAACFAACFAALAYGVWLGRPLFQSDESKLKEAVDVWCKTNVADPEYEILAVEKDKDWLLNSRANATIRARNAFGGWIIKTIQFRIAHSSYQPWTVIDFRE